MPFAPSPELAASSVAAPCIWLAADAMLTDASRSSAMIARSRSIIAAKAWPNASSSERGRTCAVRSPCASRSAVIDISER